MVNLAESRASAKPDVQADVAAARPLARWWPDALIAVVLGLIAFLYRRHFPTDGLFYDDGWQAFGAIKGSFSQVLTVGQPSPGFGLELMVWARIFGDSAVSLITPALIAGAIGPPALYLVLRRFGVARSIAALLGAALTVCAAHVIYSGRVKVYTSDILVVLLVASVLPWLARRSWRLSTAVGWFVGAMLLASFSSFGMVATIAAAIILVLQPRGDLRVRVGAVAAQAVGVLVLLAAIGRTHSQKVLADEFARYDSYVPATLNPVTFVRETFHHLTRITAVFPGGPAWFTVVCLVVAAIGLGMAAAGAGARAIAARFMIVMVLIAFVGSVAQQVPFGPRPGTSRLVLWMTPIVAFGIAVVLQRARREIARRGSSWKRAFDASAFVVAGLVLLTGMAPQAPYPEGGAAAASRFAMDHLGPRDAVLVTGPSMYSFALDTHAPARLQPAPDRDVGFLPEFDDPRIQIYDGFTKLDVASADRVFVVDSGADSPDYQRYRATMTRTLQRLGFEVESRTDLNQAWVIVWHRRP